MIDCAILGDSIAVGVSQQRPECIRMATVGISSMAYIQRFPRHVNSGNILISLGSNDSSHVTTKTALETLRERVHGQVTWLLSANNQAAHDIARAVAARFGDRVLEVRPVVSRDGVHPTTAGYRELANGWRN